MTTAIAYAALVAALATAYAVATLARLSGDIERAVDSLNRSGGLT